MAHDFNNLLQAILGYGDMALDEAGAGSPVRASIEEILKAGHRARTLVSQLPAFSRRQVLDMKDVNLNDVITELMKMIRRVIGEHAGKIDLALLDVIMPKLGGKAVFERIHETRPDMRFLFASGYSMNAIHTNFVLDEGLICSSPSPIGVRTCCARFVKRSIPRNDTRL